MAQILVTGGSGFVASHCIVQLLGAGHDVRTTVRSPNREPEVRAMAAAGGVADPVRLSFATADLSSDSGWAGAVEGCDYVLHVASPFPQAAPRHEDELIVPAREGALRVLRAARDAGVKRVVLTSSFAAVGYGHGSRDEPYDEATWTNPDAPGLSAYVRSKTLAERAAWEFVAREGRGLSLSVVNPVVIFGPALGPDYSTSVAVLKRMLSGRVPFVPRLEFGVVDVRDVADLHVRAMTSPAADGQRFLAVSGRFMSLLDIARVLRARLGSRAARVPSRELPDWLARALALVVPDMRQMRSEIGLRRDATSAKATGLLGWSPRPPDEAIIATAEGI